MNKEVSKRVEEIALDLTSHISVVDTAGEVAVALKVPLVHGEGRLGPVRRDARRGDEAVLHEIVKLNAIELVFLHSVVSLIVRPVLRTLSFYPASLHQKDGPHRLVRRPSSPGGTLLIIIPFRRSGMRTDQTFVWRVASEFQVAILRRVPYGPDQRESIRPIP